MQDSEVLAQVRQQLRDCGHSELVRLVTPSIENGRLVLRGTVKSFYMKQKAQAAAIRGQINGYAINNLLEVTGESS